MIHRSTSLGHRHAELMGMLHHMKYEYYRKIIALFPFCFGFGNLFHEND